MQQTFILLWFGETDVAEALGEFPSEAAARREIKNRRNNWQGRFKIVPVQ